jgi:predicted AAA+ superfamily ATPase
MKRKIENTLSEWKDTKNALPLMLIGARQTGKTYIIRKFCKENFGNVVELNFFENKSHKTFFAGSLSPKDIVANIQTFLGKEINPENTILFFDEIQDCEDAITSLKFFAEYETQYSVIVAGSLLGVKINRMKTPFPVGKVQIENLYPFDFEEFLWANDEDILANEIRKHFESNQAFVGAIHEKALTLYKKFLYIGGMPAVVKNFAENDFQIKKLKPKIKADIITGYYADIAKYSENINSLKIIKVFDSIHLQLAQQQKKFKYKLVEEKGNKNKFETAIEWLLQAGIVNQCKCVLTPHRPLKQDENAMFFKLYLLDTGLLCYMAEVEIFDILQREKFDYLGALTENFVAQTLTANGKKLFYWISGNEAEVDFLLNLDHDIIPCEVKSSDNVKAKSLNEYVKAYKPAYSFRISAKNFGFENDIKSVPLYAIHCI